MALVQEARRRLKQRDYPKAIEMLQQIPETERAPEAAKLLAHALKLMDEVNFVLQEMEAALQSRDGAKLARRAQELVSLKPDHPRARQVRELIKKHGPDKALQFLAEDSGTTPARPVGRPVGRWAGGLAAGMALLFAIIWFQFGDSRVKVEVLAEGYEVKFNEAEITITDGTRETKVKPGDHTLHIKSLKPGDDGVVDEFDTEQLTLTKGGQAVLIVTRENSEVVAKLDGQVIPRKSLAVSSTGQSNVGTTNATDANEKTLMYETSDELIQNGSGADAGPGGLVGWKVLSGQWDKTYTWFDPGPPKYLIAGNVASGTIEQDVDVSRFADAIDSSNVEFKLSWKLNCFDSDIGRLELIPLDGNRKELATSYDSGWKNHRSPTDWKQFDSSTFPVKGVRYVRLKLTCQRTSRPGNKQCSASVREISLRALVKKPFSAPDVRDDGPWISLFNGKDLANWKLHADQPGGWTVEDGLLVGRSWDANHLFTESGDFEDFHLRAELKTEHQSNGGICIRSPFALDLGGKFPSGYEAQVLHSHARGPWTGSLLTPGVPVIDQLPHERPVLVAGEWFTMDVIAVANVFTVKVNGKTTRNILDGSNLYRTGHIALQAMVETGVTTPTIIHFKKIELKRFKTATAEVRGESPSRTSTAGATTASDATTRSAQIPKEAGLPLRWLSLSVHDPGAFDAAANLANLIEDRSWQTHGDALTRKARERGVPTILAFHRSDYIEYLAGRAPDFESRLHEFVKANRDVIAGVAFLAPYSNTERECIEHVGPFGRRLKAAFPGLSFWASYIESPANWVGPLPAIPPEVDVVQMEAYFAWTPQAVQAKFDQNLPKWRALATGRPLMFRWVSLQLKSQPQVLKTEAGTVDRVLATAVQLGLPGVGMDFFGPRADGYSTPIDSDPRALAELTAFAQRHRYGEQDRLRGKSTLVSLSALNSDGVDDASPWVIPSGLAIYFTREQSGKDPTVFRAERRDLNTPFTTPQPVLTGRHMAVSGDETYAVLLPGQYVAAGALSEISRAKATDPWSEPRLIASLASQASPKSPWLSADGLTLVYQRKRTGSDVAGQSTEFAICRRKSRTEAWGEPALLPISPSGSLTQTLTWPCLTEDLLTLTFCHGGDRHPEVYTASRKLATEPFGNFVRIDVDSRPLIGRSPRVCAATGDLYLSSDRDPNKPDSDLFCVTTRSRSSLSEPSVAPGLPPAAPSVTTGSEDWTNLFNGRDLTGWTAIGVQGWRVENGVLIGESKTDPGWLRTNAEYDNFELDFEYRLSPGTASGVFLRAWPDGPVGGRDFLEIQVLDESDEEHRKLPASVRTGALFRQLEARPLTELRPNVWHRMNIAISGEELRVGVNGQEVTRGKIPSGKRPRGHIGLQLFPLGKPQRCEFQKLRVRPLKEGLPTEPAMAKAPEGTPLKAPAAQPDMEKAGAPGDREPQELRHGLKAEIFEGQNFERKVCEQIEPSVECFWELGAPAGEAPVDNFSVRFTGWLRAPKTGRYKLFLASKDGARLKINNQTIIDNWKLKPDLAEVSVELTQDPQPIEVHVANSRLHSWVSLLWQPAGIPTVCHIPATALFPDLESARSKASRSSIEKTGLVAEYFDKTFSRRLVTDRVFRIEEMWGPYSPRWGLPSDSAVRYSGILVPPITGNYKLIAGAREHLRVWIDDKPTLEARGMKAGQNAVVELVVNKPHEIRVEVVTTTHGAHYLHWIPPQSTKEVSIPPECLFPNKAAVRQARSPRDTTAIPADPPGNPGLDEWRDLLNGRDLSGWEVVNSRGVFQAATDGGWPVSSGVLHCDTGDDGWLRSTEDYEDFELELEFQTTASANGGILIRTRDSAAPPADGLEIDLHSSAAGGIASVVTPSKSHLRPDGEWNHLKARVTGLKYVVDLNGQRTADVDLLNHPRAFKLHRAGRIGIYNYKGTARGMAFRNIRIQTLNPPDKPVGRGDSTQP